MMWRLLIRPLMVAAAILSLAGCYNRFAGDDLLGVSYEGADALIERGQLPQDAVVVYGVFTPVGQLDRSTPFGRIIAEQMASRLVQRGRQVAEVRLGQDIVLGEGGPYTLSADARRVSNVVRARVALTGSYATTRDYILLNARLIDVSTGIVLASWDRRIKLGAAEYGLLAERPIYYPRW